MEGVRIVRGGPERVDDIGPLTRALHAHHLTVDPAVPGIPPRDEDGWWAIRRDRYVEWLSSRDAFVLVAEDEQTHEALGYALVSFHEADDSHRTGDRFAELHSLSVRDDRRGSGLGTELLHSVYREVRATGVEEMMIGVLATNERARSLYEREGFRPWVSLLLGKVPEE